MKALVIGLGIGNLYKAQFAHLGFKTVTVDKNPATNPTYTNLEDAYKDGPFDISVICTPNYTHFEIASDVSYHSKIVLVEKPGLQFPEHWEMLKNEHPKTRFMMVKNNQYRPQNKFLELMARDAASINLEWLNENRVPHPGSWFTTKKLAFGGVSRDLMPHLLSFVQAMYPQSWHDANVVDSQITQQWNLSTVGSTDYGIVNPNGTYDVDDHAYLEILLYGHRLKLVADWKNNDEDKQVLTFNFPDKTVATYNFGLCPENAYRQMIVNAVARLNDNAFWEDEFNKDMWIHKILGKL